MSSVLDRLRGLAPRAIHSVRDLSDELHRTALPAELDHLAPRIQGTEEGDPFVVDAIELSGVMRSTELEGYVEQAEQMRAAIARAIEWLEGETALAQQADHVKRVKLALEALRAGR